MRTATLLFLSFLATSLTAQTQTVHGRVDGVSGTNPQRFVLRCTDVPMVSSTLDLNLLQGQFQQFQVVDVGTPGAPVLDVRSATPLAGNFDMGNLRIGEASRWTVRGAAGNVAFMFVDAAGNTGYHPFGSAGTWLLGMGAATIASGVVAANGQFEIRFPVPPTAAPLVGTTFAGQGFVFDGSQLTFTNAECKTVESR